MLRECLRNIAGSRQAPHAREDEDNCSGREGAQKQQDGMSSL